MYSQLRWSELKCPAMDHAELFATERAEKAKKRDSSPRDCIRATEYVARLGYLWRYDSSVPETSLFSSENIRATSMLLPCVFLHAGAFSLSYANLFLLHYLLYLQDSFYRHFVTAIHFQHVRIQRVQICEK